MGNENLRLKTKTCPSCRLQTLPEHQVKRISRSGGRQTTSFRCVSCNEKSKKFKGGS